PKTNKNLKLYINSNNIRSGAMFQSQSNNSINKRLTTRGLRLIVKNILGELDIKKTVHGFRHFFTTNLINKYEGNLLEVAGHTRHKSIDTLQIYYDRAKKKEDLPRYYQAFNSINF
ncbi:MAG TPA: site-specific integrase, partial [bacterium]|nr:site-specific integrase [bacterium]